MPRSQFVRFLFAGALAAAANYGSRFGFSIWLPYAVAIICAYGVGMAVAFALTRRYVFDGGGQPVLPQVIKFSLVNVLALAQTLVVSLLLARWALPAMGVVAHAESIAHFFGVAVPLFTSFLGHRHATFRRAE